MSNNLLSIWNSRCETGFSTSVLPDGCRDVILKVVGNERPKWFISPLFDQSKNITIETNSDLVGFRMKPGVAFNEQGLISHLANKDAEHSDIRNILEDFTTLDLSVTEALACLASDITSVREAAIRLGISQRTLQRLVINRTSRPPSYWFQLARVRKAGRDLTNNEGLSCVAELHGFSDQAHMTREFQRWFKSTPSKILKTPELLDQLNDTGYA